jgi:hypothetical protein
MRFLWANKHELNAQFMKFVIRSTNRPTAAESRVMENQMQWVVRQPNSLHVQVLRLVGFQPGTVLQPGELIEVPAGKRCHI